MCADIKVCNLKGSAWLLVNATNRVLLKHYGIGRGTPDSVILLSPDLLSLIGALTTTESPIDLTSYPV